MRLTRQRQILLELIDKTGEHLDAERLFQLAKERDPKLNRVTVYRTLKMLKAGGLVDELDLMHYGGDQHYYETRLKQEHAHVICLRCGKVEEFFGEPLQRLRKQIESHFGFQVLLARTEVGGYCAHCQTLRAREVEVIAQPAGEPSAAKPAAGAPARSRARLARRTRVMEPPRRDSAPACAPASLVVIDPNGHRTRVRIEPLPFAIGRQPESDLIIRDSRVSRTHARIVAENGEYVIEDCGSRHGTYVNGQPDLRARRCAIPTASSSARRIPTSSFSPLDGAELKRLMEQMGAVREDRTARPAWAAIWPSCAPSWTWRARCRVRFRWTTCWPRWWMPRWPSPAPSAAFCCCAAARAWRRAWRATAAGTSCSDSDLRVPREVLHRALRASPRAAVHELRSAGRGRDPAARQHRRPGTAQRDLRPAGAHPHQARRRHQRALHGQRDRGCAVHGFAPDGGGPGGRQSRAAANPGHRGLHGAGKRAPARGRARQAADGGGAGPGADHPAEPAARASCPRKDGCAPPAAAWPRARWAAIITT